VPVDRVTVGEVHRLLDAARDQDLTSEHEHVQRNSAHALSPYLDSLLTFLDDLPSG
jgi:hypothetical protein